MPTTDPSKTGAPTYGGPPTELPPLAGHLRQAPSEEG